MNDTYGIIYRVTNLINNKIYIGQTIQPFKTRITQHKNTIGYRRHNSALANAFIKYGFDNFIFEEIDSAENREDLDRLEKYWISFYKSTKKSFGYNLISGGTSHGRMTDEAKQHLSKLNKGRKGKPVPEYRKKKISESLTGRKLPPEVIKKLKRTPIFCITNGKSYESIMDASRDLGIFETHIRVALTNPKYPTAKGHRFIKL